MNRHELISTQLTEDAVFDALLRPLEIALDESDREIGEHRARETDKKNLPCKPCQEGKCGLCKGCVSGHDAARRRHGKVEIRNNTGKITKTTKAAAKTVTSSMSKTPLQRRLDYAQEKLLKGVVLNDVDMMAFEAQDALNKAKAKREKEQLQHHDL